MTSCLAFGVRIVVPKAGDPEQRLWLGIVLVATELSLVTKLSVTRSCRPDEPDSTSQQARTRFLTNGSQIPDDTELPAGTIHAPAPR